MGVGVSVGSFGFVLFGEVFVSFGFGFRVRDFGGGCVGGC